MNRSLVNPGRHARARYLLLVLHEQLVDDVERELAA
jgi:hypothetical protein